MLVLTVEPYRLFSGEQTRGGDEKDTAGSTENDAFRATETRFGCRPQ